MRLLGYAAFWLAALTIFTLAFDWLYGRYFRALARALLASDDAGNTDRHTVLERLYELLGKLWEIVKCSGPHS